MAWCIKRLVKQRVGKQTSCQNIKGENRFETGAPAAIAGRLCEGHVAFTLHAALQKQKRRLLRFPGYYQYSNGTALIR